MTAGERPRGGLPDARAPGSTERPRGGLPDARAPGSTDQGWAAPPLAPPRPRTPHRRGSHGPPRVAGRPPAPGSLVSPGSLGRLAEFFAPRSIAVVGASPTSALARFVFPSATATGFAGELTPVPPLHTA